MHRRSHVFRFKVMDRAPPEFGFLEKCFLRHIGAELPIFEKSTPSYAQKLAKNDKEKHFSITEPIFSGTSIRSITIHRRSLQN